MPSIAVSPIIGNAAIKGPTAKIMNELGITVSNESIAAHYEGLIDALVIDSSDAKTASLVPMRVFATRTLMETLADRIQLAQFVIERARELRRES